LSPQPLPGFGVVVDVLLLEEVVLVVERVVVEVLDELVDVVRVEVELVVEVEVVDIVLVLVVVVVEQYWS
jgi:hypothetical protein